MFCGGGMYKITKFAGSLIPVVLCVVAGALPVCAQTSPRTPRGIYAVVAPAKEIKELSQNNPGSTTAQLYQDLAKLYSALLGNPAVSGLTLQVHWDTLSPNAPDPAASTITYDWTVVDLAFAAADSWNMQNPSGVPKTIQLIAEPGFQSPQWVRDKIQFSCDALFDNSTPPSDCGMVTFDGYSEEHDSNVLPLPWHAFYKSAWRTFLEALAARYGSGSTFVSIAVAGPTAATAEMSLPSKDNTKEQKQFSGGNISPDKMWLQLLRFHYTSPSYQGTDLAFIDEWEAAIDMYGQVFSGLTLVATTDSGLPSFSDGIPTAPGFGADCSVPTTMACAAVTTILAYFAQPSTAVADAKATQTSGFEASRAGRNLGVPGVKLLSQMTENLPAPSEVLGGTQFNTSFADFAVTQGCVSAFPPYLNNLPPGCSKQDAEVKPNSAVPAVCVPAACFAGGSYPPTLPTTTPFGKIPKEDLISPEQALYNLLYIYFNKTAAAAQFGGAPGLTPAPLNYLQIYSQDIVYATNHAQAPVPVIENGQSSPVSVTAQSMLELASQLLFQIAEPGPNN
jgi:hypothetical protein